MGLSLSEELHLFSQELQRFLSSMVLQEIAKQVCSDLVSIKQMNSSSFVFGSAKKDSINTLIQQLSHSLEKSLLPF